MLFRACDFVHPDNSFKFEHHSSTVCTWCSKGVASIEMGIRGPVGLRPNGFYIMRTLSFM